MELKHIYLLIAVLLTFYCKISISDEILQNNSFTRIVPSSSTLRLQHLVVGGPLVRVYIIKSLKWLYYRIHRYISDSKLLTQFNMVRNSTGYILNAKGIGPEMLSWLSRSYKFT